MSSGTTTIHRRRAILIAATGAALALCSAVAPAGAAPATGPLDSLVASERAFAAMSVQKGMRDAFLEFLADDAIIFRPLPVIGKPIWQARTPSPATLMWEPSHAEVSEAGDLGWTTGPWELRPPPDSTGRAAPPDGIAHGHFTTVWAKQPDGRWRVALDLGVSHGKPERGVGSGDFAPGPAHPWAAGARKRTKLHADLQSIDRVFMRDTKKRGWAALDDWLTADVRLDREGEFPYEGRDAAKDALKGAADLVRLLPQGGRAAESDDLGSMPAGADRPVQVPVPPTSLAARRRRHRRAPTRRRSRCACPRPTPV